MSINLNGLTETPFRVIESGTGNEVAGCVTLKSAESYINKEAPAGTYHILKVVRAYVGVSSATVRRVEAGTSTTTRQRRPAPEAGADA